MVFFTCDKCGESLKKNQVAKHFYCSSHSYSCMDCQMTFDRKSYSNHLKCISENEKYGGKNYVAKENKGEVKQNAWTDCVQKAIENVKEKKLKDMLIQIKDFSNIPRKEAKFINFLVNSFRVRERDLCQRAWQAIDQQVKKLQAESKPIENGNTQQNGSTEKDGSTQQNGSTDSLMKNGHQQVKESAENNVKNVEKHSVEDRGLNENESKSANEFKWKKSIKRKLKSAEEGTMKLKRLRKEVLEEYRTTFQDAEMDEDELKEIFVQKLGSAGVVVEGNVAKLV